MALKLAKREIDQRLIEKAGNLVAVLIKKLLPDRTGGTEDTIRRAKRAGKPVEVR